MNKRIFALLITPLLAFSSCQRTDDKKPIDYKSLILSASSKTLELGSSFTLNVKSGLPEGNEKVTWMSTNDNVAYVDETGLVYAYKEGECLIKGYIDSNANNQLDENEYYGECQITDILHKGVNLTLSKLKVDLQMEHTAPISAYITPAPSSGNYFYLSYVSDDSSIAYVTKNSDYNTNATVKAGNIGTTDVAVKYGGQTAYFTVNVSPWVDGDKTHVASIDFDQKSVVLKKNGSENPTLDSQLNFYPSTATDKTVTYSSNNTDVASVDENGVITGYKGGSAIITAKSNDLNKVAKMKVVVQDTYSTYSLADTDYSAYYSTLDEWENGEDLINKLHDIIRDDTPLAYGWDNIIGADTAIDNLSAVDVAYTSNQMPISEQNASFTREHVFPASLMTGVSTSDATTKKGRATDLHNLYSADKSANSSRGNKNYGYANPNNASYTKVNNDYYYDNKNFEPCDSDKGKLSRAIFYMATMYNEDTEITISDTLNFKDTDPEYSDDHKSQTVHLTYKQKGLVLREDYADYSKVSFSKFHYHEDTESQALYDKYVTLPEEELSFSELLEIEAKGYSQYTEDNCVFAHGNLSDLLMWNSFDVNYQEIKRNTYVQSKQNNRNPFIDFPELVNYAFGELKDQPGKLENIRNSYDILDCNNEETLCYAVTSYKQECAVGYEFTSADYSLKRVTKDLTYHDDVPEGEDLFQGYTFNDIDLKLGYKYVMIPTSINNIRLKVRVVSADISICNYSYRLVGKSKQDWGSPDLANFSSGDTASFGDIDWIITWTNENASVQSTYKNAGVAFGTGSESVGTITFETVNSITNVTAFFALVNAASNKTPNYKMYVGEKEIASGNYKGGGTSSAPSLIGNTFEATTGKVKIVISGATNFAIHMHTLALKY